MARLVNDIVTKLYLNSDWRDISSDVRASKGVTIQRGRKSEDGMTPPQTCSLVLKNASGDYTERDPMGQYYGYLGRNTPLDVSLRLAKDTCGTTVSNGWGTMDADAAGAWTSYTWVTADGAPSDYAKSGGKATHTISAANVGKNCYLDGFSQRDLDVTCTITTNAVSNIAGSALAVDYLMRMQGPFSNYYYVRLLINTNETIDIDFGEPATGSLLPVGSIPVPGLTWSAGLVMKFRAQLEGQTVRAKVWNAALSEPYEWGMTFTDYYPDTTVLRAAAGGFAVRSLTGVGSLNVPVVFSFDDWDIRVPQYFGEVSEWPQGRDVSGEDCTVEIEASGLLRRLSQGRSPLQSAPRRFIPTDGQGVSSVLYYWPLEDGPLVTRGEPDVGNIPLDLISALSPGRAFGQGTLAPWLGSAVRLEGVDGLATLSDLSMPGFVAANGWMVDFIRAGGASQDSVLQASYAGGTIEVTFDVSAKQISVLTSAGTTATTYTPAFDGGMHHIRLSANGVGTVSWVVLIDNELGASGSFSGTLGALDNLGISDLLAHGDQNDIGHVAVYNGSFTTSAPEAWNAAVGFRGEQALERARRLCAENSVPLTYIGDYGESTEMGSQGVKTLLELLKQCDESEGGFLFESRGASGLVMRTRPSLYNLVSWATLSLANGELSPPWSPTSDDRYLRNKVTITQEYGGSYTESLDIGKLSTLPPEDGGVGLYDDTETLSLAESTQLSDQATWRVHLGTVDEERYPSVKVELHRSQIHEDNVTLYARLLDLDVGDQVTLADLDATGIYDDTDQLVIGYERFLSRFNHTLTLTCAPASAYRVAVLDAATAILDESGTVAEDLTTTETGMDVTFATDVLWSTTEEPYDVKVGGEVMTVTTATGTSLPQTLTVTRSANGVVKSHLAGLPVSVARPVYLGL